MIYHFQCKKENHSKFSQICSYGIFSKGLKNEFEIAVVNESSVFKPLKFYCTCNTRTYTTFAINTNICTKYFLLSKVCTDEGGIK